MSIVDLTMTVAQAALIAAVVVLLRHFTPLPSWACVVLSVPLAVLSFWTALVLVMHRARRRR